MDISSFKMGIFTYERVLLGFLIQLFKIKGYIEHFSLYIDKSNKLSIDYMIYKFYLIYRIFCLPIREPLHLNIFFINNNFK